jgi:hypothetical protein
MSPDGKDQPDNRVVLASGLAYQVHGMDRPRCTRRRLDPVPRRPFPDHRGSAAAGAARPATVRPTTSEDDRAVTTLLLVYSAVLLLSVLVSSLANRTILSTAVIFLIAGFLCGSGVTNLIPLEPGDPIVATLAELALFSVLFTDGMRVGWSDRCWPPPTRCSPPPWSAMTRSRPGYGTC